MLIFSDLADDKWFGTNIATTCQVALILYDLHRAYGRSDWTTRGGDVAREKSIIVFTTVFVRLGALPTGECWPH